MIPNQTQKDIRLLEKELPVPYSFKKLISTYRSLGKKFLKERDIPSAREYFNNLFSLSVIWHEVYGHKKSGIEGREVDQAERYLKRLYRKHKTYYPYEFTVGKEIEGDVLLSATDYKNLNKLAATE